MANLLQQHFSMIRTREEVMAEIESKKHLKSMFYQWKEKDRKEFLDICTGVKGVSPMYDFVGKEVLNPESTPERIEELLSHLLGQAVRIIEVLPNDNSRLADESSLVIMDIVIRLMDDSSANLEIQKIGYSFPGQRSVCYSADLLLRQYKRVRSTRNKNKEKFAYQDIKQVYTIVLFEDSPKDFHSFPNTYLHYFEQRSDTGLELDLLQKYLFVPLDIFCKIHHNNIRIKNRLDAWLAFFCMTKPDAIIAIIEKYPDFKAIYRQIYDIFRNIEEVMGMFSEELRILDRNTVQLMIDEMQQALEQKEKRLKQLDDCIKQKNDYLKQKDDCIKQKDDCIKQKDDCIKQRDDCIKQKNDCIKQKDNSLKEALKRIADLETQLKNQG